MTDPTITPDLGHSDPTEVATGEVDSGHVVTAPRAATASNFPSGARRFPELFADDDTKPDENEGQT